MVHMYMGTKYVTILKMSSFDWDSEFAKAMTTWLSRWCRSVPFTT